MCGIICGYEPENLSVCPEILWIFLTVMTNTLESAIYEFAGFRLDSGKRLLLRDDEAIALTPKIFDTLLYLVENRGNVIQKDELMSAIWPDTVVEENNLNKNISVLRHVLGENAGEHRFIATVPGKGYKFVADVRTIPTETENAVSPNRTGFEHPGFRYIFAAAAVATVIAVIVSGYSYLNNQRPINSISVMPFVNESGNTELEYLSDGITEMLIGSLIRLPDLHVKPRSSVFRYKGKNADALTVGKELNVQAVLYGTVIQRGENLVLHVELVDAEAGNSVWQQTYNRKMSSLVELQGELARDVARGLSLKLSGSDEQKLARNYTENVEAYNLYLNGQFHFRKLTPPEIHKGIAYLKQAINIDPSYALAYATLARAHTALTMAGEAHPDEFRQAKAAAQKAVEIDDGLAEGHGALATTLFFHDWDWAQAENQFLRALEIDPNSAPTQQGYGDFLGRMGRRDEAVARLNRARELEPLSPFINAFGAMSQSDDDAALERVLFAIDLDPSFYFAHMMAGQIYRRKKMYAESIGESRLAKKLSPGQTYSDVSLAYSLIDIGKQDEARAILDELLKNSKARFVPPVHLAFVHDALGETDHALAMLEKGYEMRDPRMTFLKTQRVSNKLREDPRFQDLLLRVGF